MAERGIVQSFDEPIVGLDLRSTKLKREPTAFTVLQNTRFGEGRSLRKREGYQIIGQPGGFVRIHTYVYTDPDTGATAEELLGINSFLWRLKQGTLTVTGGAALNYSQFLDSSSTEFYFRIRNNTTAYTFSGNTYIDLGRGYEPMKGNINTAVFTVEDLRSTIDGHASLACSLPSGVRFARVNGTQSNVSTITVDAGHNYVVGDWLTLFDYNTEQLVARRVSAIAATTVSFSSSLWDTVTVYDNQVIGPMSAPAAGIHIRDAYTSGAGASVSIPFHYWDFVPYSTFVNGYNDAEPFRQMFLSRESEDFVLPEFVDANNVCYIYTRATTGNQKPYEDYPFKYDGQSLCREGLPRLTYCYAQSGGAGSLTGTYKYKIQLQYRDARGNIIEGRTTESDPVTLSANVATIRGGNPIMFKNFDDPGVASAYRYAQINGNQVGVTTITVFTAHTLEVGDTVLLYDRSTTPDIYILRTVTAVTGTSITIDGANVNVNNGEILYKATGLGFNYRTAHVNGAQSGVTSITVHGASPYENQIEVGDTVCFEDTLSGTIVERTITSRTATTIAWTDGDAINISDLSVITVNLRVKIYRTKAGGNIFYEIKRSSHFDGGLPMFQLDAVTGGTNYIFNINDDSADSTLGARLIEPDIGLEQDLPPKAAFAALHQGVRVSAGDPGSPNTIALYDVLNPESVPFSESGYIDIASSVVGPITALASDQDQALIIAKDKAIYSIDGDLAEGATNFSILAEGDYGISAQSSIARVRGAVVGAGPLGILRISGGQIDYMMARRVNGTIHKNIELSLKRAVAHNDSTNTGYHVYIPGVSLEEIGSNNYSSDPALWYFYDYEADVWFEDTRVTVGKDSVEPSGGFAIYDGAPYNLCRHPGNDTLDAGHVYRGLRLTTTMETVSQLYADNSEYISRYMSWMPHCVDPSQDKEYIRLMLYSAYNNGETGAFVPTTISVGWYKNRGTSLVATEGLSFDALTTDFGEVRLSSNKVRALEIEIRDEQLHQCFHFSGWEIVVVEPYRKSDLKV